MSLDHRGCNRRPSQLHHLSLVTGYAGDRRGDRVERLAYMGVVCVFSDRQKDREDRDRRPAETVPPQHREYERDPSPRMPSPAVQPL